MKGFEFINTGSEQTSLVHTKEISDELVGEGHKTTIHRRTNKLCKLKKKILISTNRIYLLGKISFRNEDLYV